nr:YetF domain-containing protein [Priestia aryabhattai]
MNILELIIRVAISFFVLLILTRIMGRKEISQMTFFNFVSAVTIGTLGGALVTDKTLSIRNGLIALIAWSIFTIIIGIMTIKSKKIRQLIDGEPVIVIKKGKIMEDSLQKVRLDMDSLRASLREKTFSH